MDSELSADIARCPGADAVWCDNCRRREPSSHPMQAWMETPACVDVRGCAWHIPRGYREPGPFDFMGSEGDVVEDAPRLSRGNWSQIGTASGAGCYFCVRAFGATHIRTYHTEPNGDITALCPHCGIDSLLAGVFDTKVLAACCERWFSAHAPTDFLGSEGE